MTIGPAWTFAPNNGLAIVSDTASAVTFDLERGEVVLIVAVSSGQRRRGGVI